MLQRQSLMKFYCKSHTLMPGLECPHQSPDSKELIYHLPIQPVARVKLAPLTGTSRPPRGVGSLSLAKEYSE